MPTAIVPGMNGKSKLTIKQIADIMCPADFEARMTGEELAAKLNVDETKMFKALALLEKAGKVYRSDNGEWRQAQPFVYGPSIGLRVG